MANKLTPEAARRLTAILDDVRLELQQPLGDIDAAYVAERLRAALAIVAAEGKS